MEAFSLEGAAQEFDCCCTSLSLFEMTLYWGNTLWQWSTVCELQFLWKTLQSSLVCSDSFQSAGWVLQPMVRSEQHFFNFYTFSRIIFELNFNKELIFMPASDHWSCNYFQQIGKDLYCLMQVHWSEAQYCIWLKKNHINSTLELQIMNIFIVQ